MFGWLKNKINKRLNKEQGLAILQCEGFLTYAGVYNEDLHDFDVNLTSKGNYHTKDINEKKVIESRINKVIIELQDLKKRKVFKKPFSAKDREKLLDINKECRRLYEQYFPYSNYKSFDKNFMPWGYKIK